MKKIYFTATALFFFALVQAQSLDSTLARYTSSYQPEKAYLHYDKTSYYPGETIWFKAYILDGVYPADITKTLYVDWIADNGTVLSHIVSPIISGGTNGQFEIPENYAGNFIHVRAYTKWMLNFDTAFLYSKDVRILSKTNTGKIQRPAIITSLQFFPEGGDLINGANNRIAFKANDQWGRPVKIKGALLDNKGHEIDSIWSVHDGMGSFFLTPQQDLNYNVKWKDEKGLVYTTALPAAKSSGIAIQVLASGTKRIINFNSSSTLDEQFKLLHLVGTINQSLAFKTDVAITPGNNARRIIPTESLPSGILTITVFDANWNAISERISFVNNHDYSFQPSLEVQHWGLSKRKRNELLLSLPDSLLDANLSLSVTDAAIENDSSDNIISHFLLNSDIRGKVYNAAYYFSNNSDSVAQHLDLVMLTNGWRRFKWEDVTKGKLPVINYPKDTAYLSLSGKIFGVVKSQLSGKESIVLLVKEKDSSTKMMIFPIHTDATFSDPSIILFDTIQVYYSLKSKFLSSAEAKFMTDRLPTPNYTPFSKNFISYTPFVDTNGVYHHSLMGSKSLELQNIDRGQVMETVTIKTKQKPTVQQMDEKYASGLFKDGDGYQFDLVNDPTSTAFLNALYYLQGKVAGLQIEQGSGTPTLSWRGGSPTLYLDEIQTDVDVISTISVSDIAYIKVFRPPFIGGSGGGNGAIAIYTRKGNDTQNTPGRGLSTNKISGYTPIKQFYSPNYDSFDPRNDHADIRTTLYWDPLINTTQKKHTLTFVFYNNDVTKSFRVVVEGITKDGLLTHYEQIME